MDVGGGWAAAILGDYWRFRCVLEGDIKHGMWDLEVWSCEIGGEGLEGLMDGRDDVVG